jgi:hypothetical protein
MRAPLGVGLFVLALALCAAAPGEALEFETLVASGGLRLDPGLLGDHVFRNEAEWCAFWSEAVEGSLPTPAEGGSIPSPPCPQVDFHGRTVIASVRQIGGCSHFAIESIARAGRRGTVEVVVRHFSPSPTSACICVASFWQAMHAVAVERPIRRVEFVQEFSEFDCR